MFVITELFNIGIAGIASSRHSLRDELLELVRGEGGGHANTDYFQCQGGGPQHQMRSYFLSFRKTRRGCLAQNQPTVIDAFLLKFFIYG